MVNEKHSFSHLVSISQGSNGTCESACDTSSMCGCIFSSPYCVFISASKLKGALCTAKEKETTHDSLFKEGCKMAFSL